MPLKLADEMNHTFFDIPDEYFGAFGHGKDPLDPSISGRQAFHMKSPN
jgi:hypothetical protein